MSSPITALDYVKIELRSCLKEDRAEGILANVDEGVLEQISSFLREAEIAEDKHATHCNYGNAVTWYSSTNRFRFQHTQLEQLYKYIAVLYDWGIPMFLTERQDENFNLVLDIDVKLGADMKWEHCATAEKAIIDRDGGTRFFEFILRNLSPVFPEKKHVDAALFSASGYSRDSGSFKVSLHLVFPNIIVDRRRAPKIRTHVVQMLWSASLEDNSSYDPFIATLSRDLLKLSPENRFRNVIDETSINNRFGNRLCYCDKQSRPPLVKPEGRPLKPEGILRYNRDGQKFVWLDTVLRKGACRLTDVVLPTGFNFKDPTIWVRLSAQDKLSDSKWVRLSSCRSMDGTLRKLTRWDPPNTMASRVTRTGPGGSCVDVNPQNQDAFKSRRSQLRGDTTVAGGDGKMRECAYFECTEPVTAEQFKTWLTVFDTGKWEDHIETRSISWRPSGNQGVIQYFPETRKIDVMAIDETWMDILVDLVTGPSSKLKTRHIEPSEADMLQTAGVSGAATSSRDGPESPQDEEMLEIKEVLEDYTKASDDEVELKAGELVRVIEVDQSGWTRVRKEDGSTGWVSAEFLGNPDPNRMEE